MKKKLIAALCTLAVSVGLLSGCIQGAESDAGRETSAQEETAGGAAEENTQKEEVVVTMPATSEPESGFDPAFGWGGRRTRSRTSDPEYADGYYPGSADG